MKPTLLFFTCFNVRSIQLESSIYYFHHNGYKVLFLTTCQKGPIHHELEKNGVSTEAIMIKETPRMLYYFRAIRFLIAYCSRHNVCFVHSHLQVPNLLSCIAGRLMKKTIVLNVRHNSDVITLSGSRKEKWIERLINRFSRHIIAISDKVKTQLINYEGVDPKKVHRINNGYDFKKYELLSSEPEAYKKIRIAYPCQLLVVSPGRLIKTKRHDLMIDAIRQLNNKGLDVGLLILGEGPEHEHLKKLISQSGLQSKVFLPGYHEHISDFLKSADMVALLSSSEASSNTVKEAGYFEKPVAVCRDVGDFDDYLKAGYNGWLLPKADPVPEFIAHIEELYKNKRTFDYLGIALKKTVLKEFDITEVGRQYEHLQQQLQPAS